MLVNRLVELGATATIGEWAMVSSWQWGSTNLPPLVRPSPLAPCHRHAMA